MKILDHSIQLSSFHTGEEVDLFYEEKEQKTMTRSTRGRVSGRPIPWGGGQKRLPLGVVDRVSISQQTRQKIQSQYTSSLESTSRVSRTDGSMAAEFGQKELVERLVGGVMERDVVARQLRQGDRIGPANPVSGGFESVSVHDSGQTLVSLNQTKIHFEQEQMGFSSQGQVHTQDGRMIDFSLEMSMDRAYLSKTQEQTLIHTWQEEVSFVDPLVISLDGSLPSLTDERFEFDLDNDGDLESISFVAKGSGFLSFDRNHDGKINNGSELFGPGTGNGFNELAEFDQDKNGWIDENDSVFSQLSVWTRDKDGNDQLISLKDAGIGAVYLDNAQTEFSMTTMDNQVKGEVRRSGVFLFENGNVGGIQQIDLAVRASADTNTVSPHEQGDMPGKGVDPDLGVFFSKLGLAAPGGNERETRLTELMEEIKALREEIAQILGQDTSRTRSFQGIRNQAMAFSNARIYEMIHPDPLGLKTFHSWQA